jgi:bifunctional pyridoxal-dependent enzyme with beta-cystathionase and maltose regulon repressor activities
LGELGIDCLEVPAQDAAQWLLMDLRKLMPSVDLESEQALREEFAKKARILLLSGEQLGMAEAGWFQLRIGESERHCQEG